jgi:hypothetical protein
MKLRQCAGKRVASRIGRGEALRYRLIQRSRQRDRTFAASHFEEIARELKRRRDVIRGALQEEISSKWTVVYYAL